MSVLHLVIREIVHRKISFFLGLIAVAAASGVLTAEMTLLSAHDLRTRAVLAAKEARIAEDMRVMEDEYRKIMKELGYNLLILPKGQRLDNFYDEGYASKTMPEDFVKRLAATEMVTIRHLLPSLERKVRWPERGGRNIVLMGTRGEVPFAKRNEPEPMLLAVAPGNIALGYELWNSLGLKSGDRIVLMGRRFTVSECHPQRGTKDDITAWIDLAAAQDMLGEPGLINAILALKCHCAGNDIASIRADISRILPQTQVIEMENNVVVRAKARDRAKATADSTLDAERVLRADSRRQHERFAAWMAPLVIVGSSALIGLLMFADVRGRREEIAILRAVGYPSGRIAALFLMKAVLIGSAGSIAGYIAGFTAGGMAGESFGKSGALAALFDPGLGLLVVCASTILAAAVSLAPSLAAAVEDPADILGRE